MSGTDSLIGSSGFASRLAAAFAALAFSAAAAIGAALRSASAVVSTGDVDPGALGELIDAGLNDAVAGLEAAGDLGILAFGSAHGDVADRDGIVRLHQPDISVRSGALDSGGRQQNNARL